MRSGWTERNVCIFHSSLNERHLFPPEGAFSVARKEGTDQILNFRCCWGLHRRPNRKFSFDFIIFGVIVLLHLQKTLVCVCECVCVLQKGKSSTLISLFIRGTNAQITFINALPKHVWQSRFRCKLANTSWAWASVRPRRKELMPHRFPACAP